LFVSFTLDPMLSSIWPDPEVEHGGTRSGKLGPIRRFSRAFNDGFERLADKYPKWLDWSLRRRGLVMAGAALSVVIAGLILPRLGFTWMPDYDAGEFQVNFQAPPGSRLEYTLARGFLVSDMLAKQPEVEALYMSVGGGFRGTGNSGQVNVRLKPKDQRERTMFDLQNELRAELRSVPGVRINVTGAMGGNMFGGGGRQPIQINVQGPEASRLKIVAQQVLEEVQKIKGVADPNSNDQGEIPQLDVLVDREQAWAAGVGIGTIASTLQPLFTGQRVTLWEDPQGYSHDVVVVYPDSMRTSAADVGDIPVPSQNFNPSTGQPVIVPLSQVAEIRAGVGPQAIERRALERQVTINVGVLPGEAVGDVADRVRTMIDQMGLPPGYRAIFTGEVQNLAETKGYVAEALVLAVLFIYLILASLFGSFFQPLAIMLALPLSFLGVALALLITNGNLNVMTMIGIVMLMGLVTKNGILLVDFTNQERERGTPRHDALLAAGRIRLRPILMTTFAMIFGMIPLAMAIGEGAEQRAPMARAVIGGLITSTLLTLFVVPVVYTLIEDATSAVGRWKIFRSKPVTVHGEPIPQMGD
jgi:HAE1 family hydrophobic/amphiphilic exporter-1